MSKSKIKKKVTRHFSHKKQSSGSKKMNKRHIAPKSMNIRKGYRSINHKLSNRSNKISKKVAIDKKKLSLEKNRLIEAEAKASYNASLIDEMIKDNSFSNYIVKAVGKRALDILSALREPQTDDDLSTSLNIKINEVRRILNTLNTYGIAKYDTNKDSKGWLTFKWYINFENIKKVKENLLTEVKNSAYILPDNCNDFFICEACFEKQRTLFPFETAMEMNFKCDCGGKLVRISREDAERIVEKEAVTYA
ncbi:MAG: hypothetical protein ACP5RF_00975 [Candidatus Micrarchaeia archaeon]